MTRVAVSILLIILPIPCAGVIAENKDHEISIGVLTPLTSSSRSFGTDHLQAITLAIEKANKDHLLGDYRLQLVIADDESTPDAVLGKIRQMDKCGVIAVLGPCNSDIALSSIKKVLKQEKLRIPFVSALVTAPEITGESGHEMFFRANVSDSKRIHEIISLVITSTRPQRVALVYEGHDDPYGEGMKRCAETVLSSGYKDVTKWSAFEHERNIEHPAARELMEQLRKRGYATETSAVIFLDLDHDGQTLAEEARALGFVSKLYVVEADHRRIQGALKEGRQLGGLRLVSAYYPRSATLHPFKAAFVDRYNEEPTFASALSYDAAQILLDAIRVVLKQNDGTAGSIARLRDAVAEEIRGGNRSSVKFVLSGNQRFVKGEYESLQFNGYHFTHRGEIVPWNEPLGEPFPPVVEEMKPPMPTFSHIALLVLSAILGGWLRKVYRRRRTSTVHWIAYVKDLKDMRVLLIDPMLASVVFSWLYLYVVLSHPDWFFATGSPTNLFYLSTFVAGTISGIFGIAIIIKIADLFGISVEDASKQVANTG